MDFLHKHPWGPRLSGFPEVVTSAVRGRRVNEDFCLEPSHSRRSNSEKEGEKRPKAKSEDKKPMVSTLTHTTREVAEHFLEWRKRFKKLIGHNGGPKIDD